MLAFNTVARASLRQVSASSSSSSSRRSYAQIDTRSFYTKYGAWILGAGAIASTALIIATKPKPKNPAPAAGSGADTMGASPDGKQTPPPRYSK